MFLKVCGKANMNIYICSSIYLKHKKTGSYG